MKKFSIYISTILCFVTLVGVAQMKKAEKHFSKFNYAKAIPAFEKVSKGKSTDKQMATIKLADCYRILNNYSKSEEENKLWESLLKAKDELIESQKLLITTLTQQKKEV